jgi:circadian clock protein KaiC
MPSEPANTAEAAGIAAVIPLEKAPTGIKGFDEISGGGGLPRGRSTLVTGSAGVGKTIFGLLFLVNGALEFQEPGVLLSFEESRPSIVQNASSLGFGLADLLQTGQLALESIQTYPDETEAIGSFDLEGLFLRLELAIELMRDRGITLLMSVLTETGHEHSSVVGMSSIIDTWLLLKNVEANGERTRLIVVIKSRGSYHSNQMREFRLTGQGPVLEKVVIGPAGSLTGSARLTHTHKALASKTHQLAAVRKKRQDMELHVAQMEVQIALMRGQIKRDLAEQEQAITEEQELRAAQASDLLLREQHRGEGS